MWILEWIVAEMEAQKFPVKSLKSEEPDCLSAAPIGEHPSAKRERVMQWCTQGKALRTLWNPHFPKSAKKNFFLNLCATIHLHKRYCRHFYLANTPVKKDAGYAH